MTSVEPSAACSACSTGAGHGFLCPGCGRLQPIRDPQDYLGFLGFDEPQFDRDELDRRYYALSRQLHPDRFTGRSAEEMRASVRASATLNAAYRTLRDPEARGRWWLGRLGGKLNNGDTSLSPELAGFVFAAQEAIEAARGGDPEARAAVGQMAAAVADHRARGLANLEATLARWPSPARQQAEDEPAAGSREHLRAVLAELAYLRTLERDLQRTVASVEVS